jgi:hypothetical protein
MDNKGLRKEEEFVKDCLIKHFGGPNRATARNGENPPDIYLKIDGIEAAVEITQLSPVTFDKSGQVQNRNTQDMCGVRLVEELDQKLRDKVPDDSFVLVWIEMPIQDTRKFKQDLFQFLDELLVKKALTDEWTEVCIEGKPVRFVKLQGEPGSDTRTRIEPFIGNSNERIKILPNAVFILEDRIRAKEQKCQNLTFGGPRWLALFNQYELADLHTYQQAIKASKEHHSFQKILLVLDRGSGTAHEVHLLYEKT